MEAAAARRDAAILAAGVRVRPERFCHDRGRFRGWLPAGRGAVRRWTNTGAIADRYGYSYTMLGGETIHWDFFALFPGRFEESILPSLMTVSHPVHTAMIALGCGMAYRLRKRLGRAAYLLPLALLLWAILDHAAYNGQGRLPDWVTTLHGWTGSGYETKPVFLLMLAIAVIWDYASLNLARRKLPALPGESFFDPFSELWSMAEALFDGRGRGRFAYLLAFYRERRELAYILLHGNAEAAGKEERVRERMKRHYRAAAGLAAVLLAIGAFAGYQAFALHPASAPAGDACFACMFDSLQNWWERPADSSKPRSSSARWRSRCCSSNFGRRSASRSPCPALPEAGTNRRRHPRSQAAAYARERDRRGRRHRAEPAAGRQSHGMDREERAQAVREPAA